MSKIANSFGAVATILAILLSAGASYANDTWVSHTGDDGNDCTDTLPCRTLSGAYGKTIAGTIHILDSGDFGALTGITHQIVIINEGAGTASTIGISIQTPPSDSVILRGLTFFAHAGLSAIDVTSVNTLVVDHCDIQGFQTGATAIHFAPNNAARLEVIDSVLALDGTSTLGAIHIAPQPGGSVTAEIERVRVLEAAGNGIRVDSTSSGAGAVKVQLRDVTVRSAGGGSGIVAVSPPSGGPPAVIYADGVIATGNAGYGLRAVGGTAAVYLNRSTITNNAVGINASSGGAVISYSNNSFAGNTSDGAPTSLIGLK